MVSVKTVNKTLGGQAPLEPPANRGVVSITRKGDKMAKKAKAAKPEPVVVVKTTPPNTSKRAVARLKVREAKHGSVIPRSKQLWDKETLTWVS